jgi:hypothetical protein
MVLVAEIVVVVVLAALAVRWYLRTPIHRARKTSGVFPPQVAGHMGFGMYSPSNPPLLPHALNRHRTDSEDDEERDAAGAPHRRRPWQGLRPRRRG